MRSVVVVLAVFALAGMVERASAGLILQDQEGLSTQILYGSPIGQTFTAEDAEIQSIAFSLQDDNTGELNGLTTVKLYEGIGTGGTLLGQDSLEVTPGTHGFVDFDFTSVILTVGDVYTAIIERSNTRWMLEYSQHSYPSGSQISGKIDYVGGDMIRWGSVETILDTRFRVTPANSTVPEPPTFLIWSLGLLGLAWHTRRRRT